MMSAPAPSTDQRLEITLLQERSTGTFARVYLAEARGSGGLSRVVAVKVIKEQWSDSAEILSRSRDEARLLSRLQHRNILRVEALARVDGQPALVMEFVDGVDLRELILGLADQGQRMPARSLYSVLAAAASALAAAYEDVPLAMSGPLRVVHRDIKPSNIMISRQGEVKVLDFGTARFDLTDRQAKTGAMRFGSLKYMSPERRDGERGDHPSDVYALGLVALELLLGELLPVLPVRAAEHDALLGDIIDRLDGLGLPDARWDDALRQTLRGMVAADPARRLHASQVVPLFRSFSDNATGDSLETFAARAVASLGHSPPAAAPAEISGSRVFTAATTSSDLPPPSTGSPRLTRGRTMVPDPATAAEPAAPAPTPVEVSITADPQGALDEATLRSSAAWQDGADRTEHTGDSPITPRPEDGALPVRAATDPKGAPLPVHTAPTAGTFPDPVSVTRPSSPAWPQPELPPASAPAAPPVQVAPAAPRHRSNLAVGLITMAVVFFGGGLLLTVIAGGAGAWWYTHQGDGAVDGAPADPATAGTDPALAALAGGDTVTVALASDDELLQWIAIEDGAGQRLVKGTPEGSVDLPAGDYTLRVKVRARSAVAAPLRVDADLDLRCESAAKGAVTCARSDGEELTLSP